MKTVFLVAVLFCQVGMGADWICGEAASIRKSDIVMACGIGYGENEGKARDSAFEAARREFTNICEDSVDCKDREVIVTPLRNSCEKDGVNFKCYRGVEYKILEKRMVERTTKRTREVKNPPNEEIDWRFRAGIGYGGSSVSNLNTSSGFVCCGSFDLELQRKIIWRIHLGVRYSHRVGTLANSTQDINLSENEFSLSIPLAVTNNLFLAPEYGYVYSSITSEEFSIQQKFVGAQIRYESDFYNLSQVNLGVYAVGGYRNYSGNGTANIGCGLQFGF